MREVRANVRAAVNCIFQRTPAHDSRIKAAAQRAASA
jgi:hypothetical protein